MASCVEQADTRSSLLVRAKIRSELEQSWWMYPIARFFGHALYEYRYDIDFSEFATDVNQERNLILYQSYCDLNLDDASSWFGHKNKVLVLQSLGSLVAKSVLDRGHGTKPQDVIMGIIGFAYIHPEDKRESILNLLRATHGVHHFGCVMMRYCNFFKCMCLEDMRTCITSADLKLHTFWKQIMDLLSECIYLKEHHKYFEELQKVFDLRDYCNLPASLVSIPFICEIGIKLNSGPDYDNLMKDLQSQFTTAISHKKAIEYVKATEEENTEVLIMDKEKASEDTSDGSGDKNTSSNDLTKSVGDIKESESKLISSSEDTQRHEEAEKSTCSLSPYEAIQVVIEKFKSANEPIPATLLSNLSHLRVKDPYNEYARSKSTKAHSPPSTSQSKSMKSCWPPSRSTKGLAVSQSSVAVTSHAFSSPAPLHRTKEKLFSPKLVFSSGLFSTDAAERNRIIVDLPNSDSSRENYILNEYDCRMKKHITFQAATFELLSAKKNLHEVSNLIHQQRRFEEKWPSRYSETSPSEEFYDDSVYDLNVEVSEVDMTEMVKESQEIIKTLQQLLNNVDCVKCR